jgi:hypothetical protein
VGHELLGVPTTGGPATIIYRKVRSEISTGANPAMTCVVASRDSPTCPNMDECVSIRSTRKLEKRADERQIGKPQKSVHERSK